MESAITTGFDLILLSPYLVCNTSAYHKYEIRCKIDREMHEIKFTSQFIVVGNLEHEIGGRLRRDKYVKFNWEQSMRTYV